MLCILAAIAAIGGCGHGQGVYEAPIPPSAVRPLRVLDLTNGIVYPAPEGFAPTATRLVFRRIPTATRNVAKDDTLVQTGQVAVATTSFTPTGHEWLSMYEISQEQWNALCNVTGFDLSNPWNNVIPNTAGGGAPAISPTKPAWGLAFADCVPVLQTWTTAHPSAELRLPTADEWESAARSPEGAGDYGWGNDPAGAGSYALVHETGGSAGPRAITSGTMLGGFYNMHGNVWEWVSGTGSDSNHLRGGSWCDGVRSAQSGNRRACRIDSSYALAGMRPVLVLP